MLTWNETSGCYVGKTPDGHTIRVNGDLFAEDRVEIAKKYRKEYSLSEEEADAKAWDELILVSGWRLDMEAVTIEVPWYSPTCEHTWNDDPTEIPTSCPICGEETDQIGPVFDEARIKGTTYTPYTEESAWTTLANRALALNAQDNFLQPEI